ncbi:hypothetical protein OGAPHI_001380 [Ogataea philodendri]|uniref:Transcription factor domain-containing protein n=1 Tax=Ogataea philodendri TaxID=1378263 RepID=A0A9P8T885_9ASCO|nr:uncharacterized protein OGAPHI_001380 [Ogataea philodendri]KAH3669259.1 hypothetical protein OGAPHI_001380 [Ogataea philodendri]
MVPGDQRPTKVAPVGPPTVSVSTPASIPTRNSSLYDLKLLLNDPPPPPPLTPQLTTSLPSTNDKKSWDFTSIDSEVSVESPEFEYATLRERLRDYMFLNAITTSPSSPNLSTDLNGNMSIDAQLLNWTKAINEFQHTSSSSGDNYSDDNKLLSADEKLVLLTRYVTEIGPWLDMFDHQCYFTSTLSVMAEDESVLYAILTISSRQRDKLQNHKPGSELTYGLYERSLASLLPKVRQIPDARVIASCVILCCFEMMASDPSVTWKKHLQGCAALFRVSEMHGFCGRLRQAVFWCFARMDVMHSISAKTSTVIPCERWLPPGYSVNKAKNLFLLPQSNLTAARDMYANYIVFLLARVCDTVYSTDITPERFESEWIQLYTELDRWWQERPAEMKPVVTQYTENCPFPSILFCVTPAISGTQMFHTAVILLMKFKTRVLRPLPVIQTDPVMRKSLIWHAKCVVGISLANGHHGCLNNALQPIWVAGKFMSSKEEQQVIVDLLQKIEDTTGWSTGWRIQDLRDHWSE